MRAAFFDVDGTLARTNVVLTYAHFRRSRLPRLLRWAWTVGFLPRAVRLALLDRRDRALFNEAFYRSYGGVRPEDLQAWAHEAVEGYWRRRVYREAMQALRRHRERGDQVVLLSGGLDATLRPLAEWLGVDHLVGAELQVHDGVFNGLLSHPPLSGDVKADAARRAAERLGVELVDSFAYANDLSDLPVLESVGNPVAVNPDRPLRRLAKRRGWALVRWSRPGTTRDAAISVRRAGRDGHGH